MSISARRQAPAPKPWTGITRGRLGSPDSMMRPRARLPVKAVGSFVPGLTKTAFEKHGFSAATLITEWASIAGADLARMAVPERVKWPRVPVDGDPEANTGRMGATLVLRVDPAMALDVEYRTRQIIDRVNSYFGYRAVAELRILQAPLDQAQPRRAPVPGGKPVSAAAPAPAGPRPDLGEGPLAEALARLEAAIQSRRVNR